MEMETEEMETEEMETDIDRSESGGVLSSPGRIATAFGSVLGGWVLLHLLLLALWPDRSAPGFLGTFSEQGGEYSTGEIIILPWLFVFAFAAAARLRESHPRVFAGSSTASGSRGAFRTSFGIYFALAFVGGLVESVIDFHFATSIGHYGAVAVVALGLAIAGRRWPFRHLTLDGAEAPEVATVRRRADRWLWLLVPLVYGAWVLHYPIWRVQYQVPGWQWSLILLALAWPCVGLGWALLHCTPVSRLGRWAVRRLEARAPADPAPMTSWAILREASGQVLVAGGLLVLLRLLYWPVEVAWQADAWIFSRGHANQVFLGVDWYFTSVREWILGSELFVLMGFAILTGFVIRAGSGGSRGASTEKRSLGALRDGSPGASREKLELRRVDARSWHDLRPGQNCRDAERRAANR